MKVIQFVGLLAGFSCTGVNGRAVNISNVWFLPQEGYPVFYRYFSEKLTWNEADAICDAHHADLISVQTNSQMDAARAYLKEIDVTDNIWIGLRKQSPEKPFSWMNGDVLLGDGYWTEPIPKTNEDLCAAIDPVSDYRWNSFYCRGPQVASFVCELQVPDWAKKDNSCLITSLPSLTVTLLPEVGVIQLLSDCGLDGTRRIACNVGVNREETIRRLSCGGDSFTTSDSTRRGSTTNSYTPQTRHKRADDGVTENVQEDFRSTKQSPSPLPNIPAHGFPHSPYSAAVRNAPSTKKPGKRKRPSPTPESYSTSDNPQIVVMIEDEIDPFLVPLSSDVFVNNPSLSPVEVINVDLVEVDNLTANATNQTSETPVAVHSLRLLDVSFLPTSTTTKPQKTSPGKEDEEEEKEEENSDAPQRPNRARLLTHSNHPSFYPRFLNRVLG